MTHAAVQSILAGPQKKKPKESTNRAIKKKELLHLLRKIKPHIADSIVTAAEIMKDTKVSELQRLKAITIILDNYKDLVKEAYIDEDAEDAESTTSSQAAPLGTVVSFKYKSTEENN